MPLRYVHAEDPIPAYVSDPYQPKPLDPTPPDAPVEWWWMWPPARGSWGVLALRSAMLWILLLALLLVFLDTCYTVGLTWIVFVLVTTYLAFTCGGYPLRCIHGPAPWFLALAAFLVLLGIFTPLTAYYGPDACEYAPYAAVGGHSRVRVQEAVQNAGTRAEGAIASEVLREAMRASGGGSG
jgi:energy-coupling factor transporter transmembrane protein EcfT